MPVLRTSLQTLSSRTRREIAFALCALIVGVAGAGTVIFSTWFHFNPPTGLFMAAIAIYLAFRFAAAPLFLRIANVPSIGYAARILAAHVQRAQRAGMDHPMHLYFDDPAAGRYLVTLLSVRTSAESQIPYSTHDDWPPGFEPVRGSLWKDQIDGHEFVLADADRSANSVTLNGVTEKTSIWVGTARQLLQRYRCVKPTP